MNFLEAIYNLKRKSQLTGNPLTSRNINALTSGYIESATDMMNNQRAVDLQEDALAQTAKANAASLAEAKRQAEESSAQSTIESAAQMKAAEEASSNALKGNILSSTASTIETGILAYPGTIRDLASGASAVLGNIGRETLVDPTLHTLASEGAASTLAGSLAPTTEAVGSLSSTAATGQLTGTTTAGSGAGAGGASTGTLSGAGVGGVAAAALVGAALTKEKMKDYTDRGGVTGYLARASQHPVASVLTPGQALVDAGIIDEDTALGKFITLPTKVENFVMDPVTKWIASGLDCIIVTACTDRHSPEVEIAREYRDKFMSPDQLRGYYMIAEAIMPWVIRHRAFVKTQFVDRLVEYGRYHLGYSEKTPSRAAYAVSRGFLFLCRLVGNRRESFRRCNGEVF